MRTKNKKKINFLKREVSDSFALSVIILVGLFFVYLIWQKSTNMNRVAIERMYVEQDAYLADHARANLKSKNSSKKELGGIPYTNSDLGFQIFFPQDEKHYATKEIKLAKGNAVVFGLATNDSNYGDKYAGLFQIAALPLSKDGTHQKLECIGKDSEANIFCKKSGVELAKNDKSVFIYTKIDPAGKNGDPFPADFDARIFGQADEIIKSFQLLKS